ncbi:MAG: nicotinamide mononucleotide transporter [Bacteroidetes bacterium]|nr:nicotinamide mononucleotide transporter [Bacteroidota bacterium]
MHRVAKLAECGIFGGMNMGLELSSATVLLEPAGALLALLCVWLAARGSLWNWPVAILSTLIYALLFYQIRLYSDAALQIVFLISQVYGWWNWKYTSRNSSTMVPEHLKSFYTVLLCVLSVFVGAGWYLALRKIKPDAAYPAWDTALAVSSLLATWLQARKYIQNWYVWIVTDLLYVPLYLLLGYQVTAILYFIFALLACYGLYHWRTLSLPKTK